MNSIVKMALAALLQGTLASRTAEAAGRMSIPILFGMVALFFATAAIGCLTVALWVLLAPTIGPIWTPVACAGALLAVAGIILLTGFIISRRMKERSRPAAAPIVPEQLLSDIGGMLKKHQSSLLIAAVVAGLMAGTGRRD
ncbi:MAG: hypothetical protein WD044_08630 [Dongiaceae bacterium]